MGSVNPTQILMPAHSTNQPISPSQDVSLVNVLGRQNLAVSAKQLEEELSLPLHTHDSRVDSTLTDGTWTVPLLPPFGPGGFLPILSSLL